jgi:hypothetical protein
MAQRGLDNFAIPESSTPGLRMTPLWGLCVWHLHCLSLFNKETFGIHTGSEGVRNGQLSGVLFSLNQTKRTNLTRVCAAWCLLCFILCRGFFLFLDLFV